MTNQAKITYELSQVDECLFATRALIQAGYPNSAFNRLYYAIFHAANALVLSHGIETKSHKGLRSKFGEAFVLTGVFTREESRIFKDLSDARDGADYGYFSDFTKSEARDYLPLVEAFVAKTKSILDLPDA